MKSTLNKEPYVSTNLNRNTGQSLRQWIEYADGVFEPVRKNGNLNKKYHGNKRTLDWWTVDKPLDWNPSNEGKKVSLNHDYGQKKHILAKSKADSGEDAAPGELTGKTVPTKAAAPGKSTLSQGAAGLWELKAKKKAEAAKNKTSAQTANIAKKEVTPPPAKESWAYTYLVPPLWKPDGHPEKEWAKTVIKDKLTGFAQGVLAVPDPVVDSVHAYGEWQSRKRR